MLHADDLDLADGVEEQPFTCAAQGRTVPGVVWTPAGSRGDAEALVLIGHGATAHKRIEYVVALARRLVREHGIAAAAIDGPGHGARRNMPADDATVFSEFLAEWSRPASTDEMVADWTAAIDAARSLPGVGRGPLGYWGLSMGTIYGIPLVAEESDVAAAVFGLMGLVGPTRDRMAADAARLNCPVLFLQQWDDSLVPRVNSSELFDAIASPDKRLHAHPGDHAQVPAEELAFSAEFLAGQLLDR